MLNHKRHPDTQQPIKSHIEPKMSDIRRIENIVGGGATNEPLDVQQPTQAIVAEPNHTHVPSNPMPSNPMPSNPMPNNPMPNNPMPSNPMPNNPMPNNPMPTIAEQPITNPTHVPARAPALTNLANDIFALSQPHTSMPNQPTQPNQTHTSMPHLPKQPHTSVPNQPNQPTQPNQPYQTHISMPHLPNQPHISMPHQPIPCQTLEIQINNKEKSFLFHDANKNYMGCFSIYEYIKYAVSHTHDNFLVGTDHTKAIPLIEKYICVATPTIITMRNYLESPFTGNIELLNRLYLYLHWFEQNSLDAELFGIEPRTAIQIHGQFDKLICAVLCHILQIISAICDKLPVSQRLTMSRYSTSIMYRLAKSTKSQIDAKIQELDYETQRATTIQANILARLDAVSQRLDAWETSQRVDTNQRLDTSQHTDTSAQSHLIDRSDPDISHIYTQNTTISDYLPNPKPIHSELHVSDLIREYVGNQSNRSSHTNQSDHSSHTNQSAHSSHTNQSNRSSHTNQSDNSSHTNQTNQSTHSSQSIPLVPNTSDTENGFQSDGEFTTINYLSTPAMPLHTRGAVHVID